MADFTKWDRKIQNLERYLKEEIQQRIGVESVNHFKKSFTDQGFTNSSLQKWEEVERRKPTSRWYGFKYKAKFSSAATARPILSGETQNLMNNIRWRTDGKSVVIEAAAKYAKIINEGGNMKVFGKHPAKMPQRQFMGESKQLRELLGRKIKEDLKRVLQ